MTAKTVLAWLALPSTVALLHRYFLGFANGLPDLRHDAGYWKRTTFNFIQSLAGNDKRIVTDRPAVTPPVTLPNDKGPTK